MKKIKLPFVSRKKYDTAKENLAIMNGARIQLNERLEKLSKENREAGLEIEKFATKAEELKKENTRLKTLLTKNGIKYKKEKK